MSHHAALVSHFRFETGITSPLAAAEICFSARCVSLQDEVNSRVSADSKCTVSQLQTDVRVKGQQLP